MLFLILGAPLPGLSKDWLTHGWPSLFSEVIVAFFLAAENH